MSPCPLFTHTISCWSTHITTQSFIFSITTHSFIFSIFSAVPMQAGIQYDRHCLPEAACLEPAPQRRPHPLLRTYSLGRRYLNPFGNFASANRIQIAVSNFTHGSNPVSRTTSVAKVDSEVKEMDENEVFIGLGDAETPVKICQTYTLPAAPTVADAVRKLKSAIADIKSCPPALESGILRFQVPLPQDVKALDWLRCQFQSSRLFPRCYFSPKGSHSHIDESKTNGLNKHMNRPNKNILKGVAGIGSAVLFKSLNHFSVNDWKAIRRFLSVDSPLIRVYGSIRFNSEAEPSLEWSGFSFFYFVVPQIELDEFDRCSFLAATIAWDNSLSWTFKNSLNKLELSLQQVSCEIKKTGNRLRLAGIKKDHLPDERSWEAAIQEFSKAANSSFTKVVLARRTQLKTETEVDSLELLACLQEKDRDFFQFYLELDASTSFMGSTPQQLFYRNGLLVSNEVVAGTHLRGCTSVQNKLFGLDLPQCGSSEDHCDFDIIEEAIKRQMELTCKHVVTEAKVEHLYTCLTGELKNEMDEFYLLSSLHPSPVICGHSREAARYFINQTEAFDRGMYGGPVGWFGGKDADFALATGSALVQKDRGSRIFVYSEAGIVKNSKLNDIWQELELKARQYESLLEPDKHLEIFPNINAVWAFLIVEECCRLGITYFCIAPGSRSSPLAVAAAQNPHASCISCIDERSLAFHALGYGKGSYKPAAVITSSGTALSNLLPAVVEASQDHVPLLLLTADRPPELHDTGANQTINQVNHFGSFVRYFSNLPPPDDKVPARMVLTTIDTAVFRATQEPFGPVHINCGFREPLAGVSCQWNLGSLKGLNMWMSKREPFTKYIRVTQFLFSEELMSTHGQYKEVVDLIQGSSRGLLILGGLQTAEETWAALSLAKHLRWPVVPDILSGMRLRKLTLATIESDFSLCFVDLLDHILLGNSVKNWISPDVVVQVGSKITSKRVAQLLEDCRPHAYIMVQNHPYRHDPSHILTHRIQASVVDFAAVIREFCTPKEMGSWCKWLQVLNNMVEWEISFQLNVEPLLTEPYVSRAVSQSLSLESAWFLGNSMAIRDADMYGLSWSKLPVGLTIDGLDTALPFSGLRVVGNRGASGIDGVLSTAIGYAAGSNQRVVFMVGDISFIHDTNGLTLLQKRAERPPITVVVINNHGGAIFSLLPIADTAPATIFRNFFSTPHDVSISNLCLAHRVKHMLVQTKQELETALLMSQEGQLDWVIEIESHIADNTAYHRVLQQSAHHAVNHAFKILSNYSQNTSLESDTFQFSVLKLEYSRYRIRLNAPATTISEKNQTQEAYREGFILTLFLDNGKRGYGEVAPIGPQNEDLLDVEEQLRFLVHRAHDMSLNYLISLLNNSFSGWIWRDIGIPACSLFPSVCCGLEMAVLSALAATSDCNIADLLLATGKTRNVQSSEEETENSSGKVSSRVQICALLDSEGPPEEVACAAEKLVEKGFHTMKLKVARRSGPLEDVAVIQSVRQKVGNLIEIRVDANRKWTFAQAMEFASHVKDCNLQYIEEPVKSPEDILRFCKESDLFIALDETIADIANQPLDRLSIFAHPKVVATVIKPSRIGGFERAAVIAKWAQKHGMMAVVSAAFESSVSLAVYAQFAYYIDNKNLEAVRTSGKQDTAMVSHGLGTYSWLRDDVMKKRLQFQVYPKCDRIEVDVDDATAILQNIEVNPDTVKPICVEAKINMYTITVNYKETCFSFRVMDTGINNQNGIIQDKTLLFLHGFLGTCNDWLPIMQALSISARCISIDLPGHGKTHVQQSSIVQNNGNAQNIPFAIDDQDKMGDRNLSIEVLAKVLCGLICQITHEKVVLVGYSMGARIALYMALKFNKQIAAAALISGSPGLQDPCMRMTRSAQDDALAESLLSGGLHSFVEMWYKREMWESLRSHPCFEKIRQGRLQHDDVKELAKALTSLSIGRQPSLWHALSGCERPLLVIAGKKDSKFKKIAQQMCNCKVDQSKHEEKRTDHTQQITVLEVDDSGHAVHLENPLPVIIAIRKFVMRTLIAAQA